MSLEEIPTDANRIPAEKSQVNQTPTRRPFKFIEYYFQSLLQIIMRRRF
ncbi:MAG TPA: hypothetical protein VHE99_08730 [Gammaproteobacteria bacterium]|nr:hypothetical protein [Gammaproteobacteria bacterium]